jgi:GABA permease
MWGFPYLTGAVLVGLVAIAVAMATIPEHRQSLWATLASVAVALVAYEVRRRWGRSPVSRTVLGVPGRADAVELARVAGPAGAAERAREAAGASGADGAAPGGRDVEPERPGGA